MKNILVGVLLALVAVSARAEDVWLIIGASDPTPAGIAKKWKKLGGNAGIIFQSRDCGDKKNIFAWAAKVESSFETAKESLKALKTSLPYAYIKTCHIKPESLLAFRENAVHKSIADVPATAVNWEDADRVSTVHLLQEGRYIVISRYYNGILDDPLEGKRERVTLVGPGQKRHLLQEDCVSPESFTFGGGVLAYQCAVEQAGDELLHNVIIFTSSGNKIKEIRHCRNPKITPQGTVACQRETVGADGALHLRIVEQKF